MVVNRSKGGRSGWGSPSGKDTGSTWAAGGPAGTVVVGGDAAPATMVVVVVMGGLPATVEVVTGVVARGAVIAGAGGSPPPIWAGRVVDDDVDEDEFDELRTVVVGAAPPRLWQGTAPILERAISTFSAGR